MKFPEATAKLINISSQSDEAPPGFLCEQKGFSKFNKCYESSITYLRIPYLRGVGSSVNPSVEEHKPKRQIIETNRHSRLNLRIHL